MTVPLDRRVAAAEEVDDLLGEHPPDVIALVHWLRRLLLDTYDRLDERLYRGWHGLGYHHDAAGYLCAIFPRDDRVLLGFERGTLMPDPAGLLEGDGRTVRYVRVHSRRTPGRRALLELVDAAIAMGGARSGAFR